MNSLADALVSAITLLFSNINFRLGQSYNAMFSHMDITSWECSYCDEVILRGWDQMEVIFLEIRGGDSMFFGALYIFFHYHCVYFFHYSLVITFQCAACLLFIVFLAQMSLLKSMGLVFWMKALLLKFHHSVMVAAEVVIYLLCNLGWLLKFPSQCNGGGGSYLFTV